MSKKTLKIPTFAKAMAGKTKKKSVNQELTDVLLASKKVYKPSKKVVAEAAVKDWEKARREADKDPLKYWEEAARDLVWFKPWTQVLDKSQKPFYKWFIGGKTNLAYNAVDRWLNTPKENQVAIMSEDETGRARKFTYKEISREINKTVNALKNIGVKKGDRVAIYMPNIPEIAFAMLACAKIGAMHSVVYAGYSATALKDRIQDASAKVVFTADGSLRRGKVINLKSVVDEAVKDCSSVEKIIVVKNNNQEVAFNSKKDIWYHDFIKDQSDEAVCEAMDSEDPAFVLYTSGTTSKPKGVVHVHGGYPVGVLRTMKWVWDVKETDIFWCTADPGWITGHSYIIYGPLLAGVTTLMYEGTPDFPEQDHIWKLVEKYKITILYTAPTLIRAMMSMGDELPDKHLMESLRLLGSVGEPINPEAWRWYFKHIGKGQCPIMDTWWQTETGCNMLTPLPSAPLKAGSATKPFPGIEADIYGMNGKKVPVGKGGYLVIKNPWPSMIRTVFNAPERYLKTYWKQIKGVYFTGDIGFKDKDGYFFIQGRTDDMLKIAGHRIGTAEVESAFVAHPSVAECGVIGVPDAIKGETIKAFCILKKGIIGSDELKAELKMHVRKTIGPVAVMSGIEFVETLPKTRSGKIMRRVLKAKELGLPLGDTSALI
ncbi:MAG: acetate--CoA ligase [Patescibacteria group bacterium]